MATGDGWTSQLVAGLAQHLEDAGVGTWRPDGSEYQADEIAITDRLIPATPDRLIVIAAYTVVRPWRGLGDITEGIQLRFRGTTDPRVCDDIADEVFDLLDSAANLSWNGIPIVQVYRQSYAPLGRDGNSRWERSDNYYIDAMRFTANRND